MSARITVATISYSEQSLDSFRLADQERVEFKELLEAVGSVDA